MRGQLSGGDVLRITDNRQYCQGGRDNLLQIQTDKIQQTHVSKYKYRQTTDCVRGEGQPLRITCRQIRIQKDNRQQTHSSVRGEGQPLRITIANTNTDRQQAQGVKGGGTIASTNTDTLQTLEEMGFWRAQGVRDIDRTEISLPKCPQNSATFVPKKEGGCQRPFKTFPKNYPFWNVWHVHHFITCVKQKLYVTTSQTGLVSAM